MPTAHKIALLGFGGIGRFLPIATAHLHFCDDKLHVVKIPEKNNVISDILQQRTFDTAPDLRLFTSFDFKLLCRIYKQVQHKYYPEKDVFKKIK